VNASDAQVWASARTLADLGELTARWIEGTFASEPGYCGPSDIEDPVMVPVLARLTRAGFMTIASQAASDGTGYDGARWQQRAAVEGFIAGTAAAYAVASAAWDAGLAVVMHCPDTLPRGRYGYGESVVVTTREGRDCTWFGVHLPRRHIRDSGIGYGICHRDAVKALCGAWQVTVIDPEWGRPGVLWQTLDEAVTGKPSARGQS
jgi:hypothetical protein